MLNKVIVISGGFDPLHSGHLSYINASAALGDRLVVALNSDEWLSRKKGRPFMTFQERQIILSNLLQVDEVYQVQDSDGSVTDCINYCLDAFPSSEIIFANGGDRTKTNIPEMKIQDSRLSFMFGVGGETKLNSSSSILADWKNPKTFRQWGYYRVLHADGPETKVKELVVEPKQKLSLQRHKHRSEHWHVSHGTATVRLGETTDNLCIFNLESNEQIRIPVGHWHQLCNETDSELRLVEIQYGNLCTEEDIERI